MAKKKKSRVSESSKVDEAESGNHPSDADMGDDGGCGQEKSLYEVLSLSFLIFPISPIGPVSINFRVIYNPK